MQKRQISGAASSGNKRRVGFAHPIFVCLFAALALLTSFHAGMFFQSRFSASISGGMRNRAGFQMDDFIQRPPELPRKRNYFSEADGDSLDSKGSLAPRKKKHVVLDDKRSWNGTSCSRLDRSQTPTFVLAGAQKAGTSAFYHLLGAHPAIQSSSRFEPHFFDHIEEIKHYRDVSTLRHSEICSYRQQYRHLWAPSAHEETSITFEKTPVYLCKYHIAPYMKAIAPWTKILVILRNPVDRAFSNWKLSYQTFEYMKPFDSVVLNEVKHLKKHGLSKVPRLNETTADEDGSASFALPISYEKRGDRALEISAKLDPKKKDKLKCGMVSRGFYAEQLSMWMRYFPLGEKLKVIRYEAFLENRAEILREVLDFVGAPAISFEDLDLDKSYSPERDGAPYEGKMPDHVREYLGRLYKPYNDELADLLGEEWRDVWD